MGALAFPQTDVRRFNSNAHCNVLFKEKSGEHFHAQAMVFEDTWEWGEEAEETYSKPSSTAVG